jgi:hypothetical protein
MIMAGDSPGTSSGRQGRGDGFTSDGSRCRLAMRPDLGIPGGRQQRLLTYPAYVLRRKVPSGQLCAWSNSPLRDRPFFRPSEGPAR